MVTSFKQQSNPDHYDRLIKRSHLSMVFWREKLIEVVGNYRAWKKTMDRAQIAPHKYHVVQTRRVKRLVAQAYVEYRRKQSELKTLVDLRNQSHQKLKHMDTALMLLMHSDDHCALQPVQTQKIA